MAKLCVISHKQFFGAPGRYETTGGFAKQIEALAPHFDEVTLCVPVEHRAASSGIGMRADNIRIVPLPGGVQSVARFYLKIIPLCRALIPRIRECDIVLPRLYGNAALLGLLLARLMRKPTVVHISSDHEDAMNLNRTGSIKSVLFNLYTAAMLRLVRRLMRGALNFVVGGSLRKKFTDRGIKVIEMHSGIITDADIRRDAADTCRGDAVTILWVGRMSGEKGLNYLLDAFAAVGKRVPAARFALVGDGPERRALETRAEESGPAGRVAFKGYIPYGEKLLAEYRGADCFVISSLRETYCKALQEAMSQGVPVVATAVGGIPFWIEHEVNGLLVPPKNSGALADAICRLVAEPETRQRLIRNGLKTAESHTIEKETEKLITAIRERYPEVMKHTG